MNGERRTLEARKYEVGTVERKAPNELARPRYLIDAFARRRKFM
jgi:hypothetical protein